MMKKRKRLWAMVLSAALMVTQLPTAAMAENQTPDDGSIASFEVLPSDVANQTVLVGTDYEDLNLPDTVKAHIYQVIDEEIPDEDILKDDHDDAPTASSSDADETVSTSIEEIPVTWDSDPDYNNGDMAGSYVFTADVGDYVLSGDAKLPQITVTVSADTVENPTKKPTVEQFPCALTEGCTLEQGHEGECVTEQFLANGMLVKTVTSWTFEDGGNLTGGELALPGVSIDNQASLDRVVFMLPTKLSTVIKGETNTVTLDITDWNCPDYIQDNDGNWPITGNYTFTAELPDGYVLAPGVIALEVPVTLGGSALYSSSADDEYSLESDGTLIITSDKGMANWQNDSPSNKNKVIFIEIKNEVTKIGGSAFSGCTNLRSIDLSDATGLTDIGTYALSGCKSLTSIDLSGATNLTSIGDNAFTKCTNLKSIDLSGLTDLTSIGNYTFSGCTNLTDINLSGATGLTSIGSRTFEKCTGLMSIGKLPDSLTSFGSYTFSGCTGLTSINLSGFPNLTSIGSFTFSGCTGLTSIDKLPDSLTSIGGNTFRDCTGLKSINLTGLTSLTNIGDSVFQGCTSLTSIDLTCLTNLKSIGGHTFRDCTKLTSIDLTGLLSLINIGDYTFYGCTNLTSIDLTGLRSLATIGNSTFSGCTSLTDIGKLPDSLTTIGSNMLKGCNLNQITIPENVTSIGDKAFLGNKNLKTIVFLRKEAPTFDMDIFEGIDSLPAVYVPGGASGYDKPGLSTMTSLGIADHPQDAAVTVGRTATFTVTADGEPPLTYQWEVNKGDGDWKAVTDGSGGTTNSYTTPAVTVEMNDWQYRCFISNTAEQATSDAATLTLKTEVSDTAVTGITPPAAETVPNTNVNDVNVDGSVGYRAEQVTWKNGNIIVSGDFDYDTAYTVSVTLKAKEGYQFANNVAGTINGQSAHVSRINDIEVILSFTFDKTGEKPPTTVAVTGVTLDQNNVLLKVTESVSLTATVKPDNATDKSVTWTSSDPNVAMVDASGKVTAQAVGKATITVTTNDGGQNATCDITVETGEKPPTTVAVTGVTLDQINVSLNVAKSVALTATVKPDNATDKSVTWTSSDPNVATVDASGKVTAHAVGKATITVTTNNGGKSASCDITVKADSSSSSGSSSGGGSQSVHEAQGSYTVAGDNISRSIFRSDLQRLIDSGKSLTLRCDKTSLTFEPAALRAILAAVPSTADSVTFAAAPADLSAFPDAANLIGVHPVYDFSISYKDGTGSPVTVPVNFPAGSAAIALNYAPAPTENTGSLFMVYVDSKGAVCWLDKSSYNNGWVLAEIPHFSTYGVAYKTPVPMFQDIANHWAKGDIEFVAARGLLTGTGDNEFSPDNTMTRGMFVTALGRLAGVNPDGYQTRSFTDVRSDAYYAPYIEWAAQKNIAGGTGDQLFSPDAPVTREQMAVMMTNYAGQMGYSIPAPLAAVTFADNDKISEWAAKEVAAMQRAGVVKDRDGNHFDPQGDATRAEGAAVLRRFTETIIDPATAGGWVRNDSGHWLYYSSGNALTGWREIDGKWYYFDGNGVMAENTKIDGYDVGPDGVRKED